MLTPSACPSESTEEEPGALSPGLGEPSPDRMSGEQLLSSIINKNLPCLRNKAPLGLDPEHPMEERSDDRSDDPSDGHIAPGSLRAEKTTAYVNQVVCLHVACPTQHHYSHSCPSSVAHIQKGPGFHVPFRKRDWRPPYTGTGQSNRLCLQCTSRSIVICWIEPSMVFMCTRLCGQRIGTQRSTANIGHGERNVTGHLRPSSILCAAKRADLETGCSWRDCFMLRHGIICVGCK